MENKKHPNGICIDAICGNKKHPNGICANLRNLWENKKHPERHLCKSAQSAGKQEAPERHLRHLPRLGAICGISPPRTASVQICAICGKTRNTRTASRAPHLNIYK
ncbi:hypothetical protein [Hallella sp.]|uniref:hypothetical protein n=1 Tax=Hallella sp. TaxID=2980186 RepID=UPI003080ADB6